MNAIAVVDKNWGIGKNGKLLVHLPGDLKYYKQKTTGKVIIIGRKTLESFPGGRALPNRVNIVLTRNREYERDDCVVCHSVKEVAEKTAAYDSHDVFVAGGAEIYGQFMDACDDFYITKIDEAYEADRYFPDLDEAGYEVVWESPVQEENGVKYRFLRYSRSV